MQRPCIACLHADDHPSMEVREMFYGSREKFVYFECSACGSLQIAEMPADIGRHYPADYYSFAANVSDTSSFEISLRRMRTNAWLGRSRGILARFLAHASRRVPVYLDWFRGLGLSTESRLLDVGCGGGQLLQKLQRDGFTKLKGIDPYLATPGTSSASLEIKRHHLAEERGEFDLIMFHHSLEHMRDPAQALADARARLSARGHILVRLPVAGCYAWRKYREHWYQIDAPRHCLLPSIRGMHLLAQRVGLRQVRTFFDSDAGQILISERYMNDIPMSAPGNPGDDRSMRISAINEFVNTLNQIGDGDCAGFVLSKQ